MTETTPVYSTLTLEYAGRLAQQLYNAVVDAIDGGMDALYCAEMARDAADTLDADVLDEICHDLEKWTRMHHDVANAVQNLVIFVHLLRRKSADDDEKNN